MEDRIASTIAELCTYKANIRLGWYCVRTHLKHEHIAAAHLRTISGVEVFNPQLRLLRSTRRGRRWCTESLFPNYLFARFELESSLDKVTFTPGVTAVLRFGGRIPEIPEPVINDLRAEMETMSSMILVDSPAEGEEVEIASGAFGGMKGVVTRVLPGKDRAKILVNVMGRLVPTEISVRLVLYHRRVPAQVALSPDKPGGSVFEREGVNLAFSGAIEKPPGLMRTV